MTQIIVDLSNQINGFTNDDTQQAWEGVRLVPAPNGFNPALLAHYEVKVAKGKTTITLNMEAALLSAKAIKTADIKAQATKLIESTDWKLQRAKERDQGGWGTLSDIDLVLAKRESIRRSSDEAEVSLNQLATIEEVQAFSWSVNVNVDPTMRLTRGEFLDRFTPTETVAIVAAAENNPSLKAWLLRMENAAWVVKTLALPGLQALEIAGLLAPGRAAEILV